MSGELTWEYGIRYDRVPSMPDMATGSAPQTHVQWVASLTVAQAAKRNKVPLSGTNHTIVRRLVGPVETVQN